jgi:hypothetical protein
MVDVGTKSQRDVGTPSHRSSVPFFLLSHAHRPPGQPPHPLLFIAPVDLPIASVVSALNLVGTGQPPCPSFLASELRRWHAPSHRLLPHPPSSSHPARRRPVSRAPFAAGPASHTSCRRPAIPLAIRRPSDLPRATVLYPHRVAAPGPHSRQGPDS